jgi:hypothetical protein
MKKTIVILLLLFLLLFLLRALSFAQELQNENYIFKLGNNASSKDSNLIPLQNKPILDKNTSAKMISGDGYTAILSYDDDNKNLPLVITISSDSINFGNIKPDEPIIRTQQIQVIPGSSHGYQIISGENETLRSGENEIPNTSCDSGNCNQILADIWSLPLVYGFGFRCDDVDEALCSPKMSKNTYKRFSNEKTGEKPSKIMYSNVSKTYSALLSYKLNISGNQPQGGYHNIIKHIIVPNL